MTDDSYSSYPLYLPSCARTREDAYSTCQRRFFYSIPRFGWKVSTESNHCNYLPQVAYYQRLVNIPDLSESR
jgi:hypothetical protein